MVELLFVRCVWCHLDRWDALGHKSAWTCPRCHSPQSDPIGAIHQHVGRDPVYPRPRGRQEALKERLRRKLHGAVSR